MLVKIPQQNSPALLVSTTHTSSDLLRAAALKNIGEKSLSACRLGWVVVFTSGRNEVHLGAPMNISAGIEPGATWEAPPQSVSPEYAEQSAIAVAFFVAEVFPSRGNPWKADLAQIKQQARSIATQAGADG
jgi:hypothetical protein